MEDMRLCKGCDRFVRVDGHRCPNAIRPSGTSGEIIMGGPTRSSRPIPNDAFHGGTSVPVVDPEYGPHLTDAIQGVQSIAGVHDPIAGREIDGGEGI